MVAEFKLYCLKINLNHENVQPKWLANASAPPPRVLDHVIWAIVCQNRPTGHFSRRVRGKEIIIKKKRLYISRIWPDAPLRPICAKFGLQVCLMDIINSAKFYRNQLRGLDFVEGRILTIPIGMWCRH